MNRVVLILTFIFFSLNEFGQTNSDSTESPFYISYRDKINVGVVGITKFNTFSITEDNNENDEIEFSTNESFSVGIGFNYKWIGFNATLNLPELNVDIEKYGKTSGIDLQVDFFTKAWLFNISSNIYEGFYWTNPNAVYKNWNTNDSVVIYPDISSITASISGLVSLNSDKLSLRSVFVGNEAQLRSAGSWLIGGQTSFHTMHSKNRLLSDNSKEIYPKIYSTQSISSLTLGASVGYTYTYVTKKGFFVNFVALPGVNIQTVTTKQFDNENDYTKKGLSTKIHFRLCSGYQNKKYFMGFMGVVDSYNLQTKIETHYRYTSGKIKMYWGMRF